MAARLAEAAELTGYVKYRPEDTPFIERLLDACSRRIIRYTGRTFFPNPALQGTPAADTGSPVLKTFTVPSSGYVTVPDLRTITAITLGGSPLLPYVPGGTGYELKGQQDEISEFGVYRYVKVTAALSPYLVAGSAALAITGRWGFLAVPEDVKDACLLWVARRFKQKDANYADVVQSGIEAISQQYFNRLPEDIKMTLDAFSVKGGPKVALV